MAKLTDLEQEFAGEIVELVKFTAIAAREQALEDAAMLIEQRNGSIPYRQEIASEIRALAFLPQSSAPDRGEG